MNVQEASVAQVDDPWDLVLLVCFASEKSWIIMKWCVLPILLANNEVNFKKKLCDLICAFKRESVYRRNFVCSQFIYKAFLNQRNELESTGGFFTAPKSINNFLKFRELMHVLFNQITDFFLTE